LSKSNEIKKVCVEVEIAKETLGRSEISQDSFSNYRRKYPSGKKSNNTFGARLEKLARLIGDKVALIQGERRLTWKQLDERVNRLANALVDLGVKKEERVGIAGFNSIEWMESYFAISRIGAVPFNLNPRFTHDEIKYVMEDADAVATLVEDEYAPAVKAVGDEVASLRNLIVYGVGKPPKDVPEGAIVYDDLMAKYPPTKPKLGYKVTNEDFAMLLYTGGTTGYPKGTVWDGEQRVKGLETLVFNGLVPIIARIDEKKTFDFVIGLNPIPGAKALFPVLRPILSLGFNKTLIARLSKRLEGTPLMIKLDRRLIKGGYKFLPAPPLFHGAAYYNVFGNIVGVGTTTVFLPTPHPFNAKEFLETIEKERVNMAMIGGDAFAIPILEELRNAKKEGRTYKLSSLTGISSSGVRWSAHIKKEMHEYMPHFIAIDGYGSTESSVAYSSIGTADDKEEAGAGAKITPKRGVYSLQARCRVVNPDTGEDVKPGSGEIGEFLTGGYMALGYWKCPKKAEHDFRVVDGERYFFAGDAGTVDAGGVFHLVGRGREEIINTGGEKVYAEEVEEVIKSHPKIRDVGVTGVLDERWGEAVTAVIELEKGEELTAEEVIDYVGQKLAGYKKPKHVIFVESLPRGASGKVERIRLKEFTRET